MAKSRRKGSSYELKVGRIISSWWMCIDFSGMRAEDLPFRRTPLSGGWEKGSDIRPVSEDLDNNWPFSVECKNREGWDWFTLIEGSQSSPILSWWDQCTSCANNHDKLPLLIFTKNRRMDYCAMRETDSAILGITPRTVLHPEQGCAIAFMKLSSLLSIHPDTVKSKLGDRYGMRGVLQEEAQQNTD